MDKNLAFAMIDNYFRSWLEQDKELFLSQLHNDIVVRECTGDMYINKDISSKWFEGWNVEGNKVLRWDILGRYYDYMNQVGVVEWIFKCIYEYKDYSFKGSSIVAFKDNLIVKINEYQMDINKKYPFGKSD